MLLNFVMFLCNVLMLYVAIGFGKLKIFQKFKYYVQ